MLSLVRVLCGVREPLVRGMRSRKHCTVLTSFNARHFIKTRFETALHSKHIRPTVQEKECVLVFKPFAYTGWQHRSSRTGTAQQIRMGHSHSYGTFQSTTALLYCTVMTPHGCRGTSTVACSCSLGFVRTTALYRVPAFCLPGPSTLKHVEHQIPPHVAPSAAPKHDDGL